MASVPFQSRILLDTGISMGDEGKGRLIPEVIRELIDLTGIPNPVGMVIKVNGGANSGHTSGGLKLNLFPAGVVESSVDRLAISGGVVADPHKINWEASYIENHGYDVRSRLYIDNRAMISDLGHRLLDLASEYYRSEILGETKRGSTGRGISPAYTDETAHFPMYFDEFLLDKPRFEQRFQARILRALATIQYVYRVTPEAWNEFFDILTRAETRANQEIIEAGLYDEEAFNFHKFKGPDPFTLNMERLTEAYWKEGLQLQSNISDVRQATLEVLQKQRYIIGEFGQAFWLDKRFGFPPNVTASHTLPAEFFLSTGVPLQPAHVFGVCKAYDTKVGTHIFVCEFPENHPLGQRLAKLEYGTTTGRQRMVGWFDAVEKGDAIRFGGSHDLVINKLDALTYGGDWTEGGELLINVAYRDQQGNLHNHVPRDMKTHAQLKPVYIQLPGWKEDISLVRTFDNLPLNAKRYVAHMMKATLDVAFEGMEQWPESIPNLRYIGVGPDPEQLIRDVPPTHELVKLCHNP